MHFSFRNFVIVCNVHRNLDGAGTNKQHVITKNTAKLDRETEELKHDKIPLEVGKIIQDGRKAKGLKQSELAAVRILTLTSLILSQSSFPNNLAAVGVYRLSFHRVYLYFVLNFHLLISFFLHLYFCFCFENRKFAKNHK